MSKSRSFDRAAGYYDQTRLMPEPITKFGLPAIEEAIGPHACVLEAGIGTGRIGIPLMERGMGLVGCDLSFAMMKRLQEKYPLARITQADASRLPFQAAQFDAVLTVHVLHLIPSWREVVHDFKRVLKPGGVYLNMRTWDSVGQSAADSIRDFWRGWMREHGVNVGHVGVRSQEELFAELRSLGAELSELEPARFTDTIHLRTELDHFANRLYSETWDIPDDLFDASIKELRHWVEQQYGDLDQQIVDQVRIVLHVARFS